MSPMRIVCLSDLHGYVCQVTHPDLGVNPYRQFSNRYRVDDSPWLPDGDVLVIAGDFTQCGHLYEVIEFNDWLGTVPIQHKIVIAGNHDHAGGLQDLRPYLDNATYLQDSGCEIAGVKFYGSPWTPQIETWEVLRPCNGDAPFVLPRGGEELRAKWDAIPVNTDVLITHGPPVGKLDFSYHKYVGCEALRDRILTVKPKLHIFGHVHSCPGVVQNADTIFVNASICNGGYQPVHEPIVIDL